MRTTWFLLSSSALLPMSLWCVCFILTGVNITPDCYGILQLQWPSGRKHWPRLLLWFCEICIFKPKPLLYVYRESKANFCSQLWSSKQDTLLSKLTWVDILPFKIWNIELLLVSCICLSIYVCTSVGRSVRSSVHPSINLSICPLIGSSFGPSIYRSVCRSVCPLYAGIFEDYWTNHYTISA